MVNWWPNGYQEDFETISIEPLKKAIELLKGDTCLEIGCGNGYWSKELLGRFKLTGIDIIEKSDFLKGEYIRLWNFDWNRKFDIIYSFGVFCHLPLWHQQDYLYKVRKMLKGKALISFANWDRHPSLSIHSNIKEIDGWYYNNLEITKTMCLNAGLNMTDIDPAYRDTIALLW
jgi:cyclopropane fatty-acyl-phospholipid synthase-like methyltransferase